MTITDTADAIDPHWNLEFSQNRVRPAPGLSKVDGLKIVANTKPPSVSTNEDTKSDN